MNSLYHQQVGTKYHIYNSLFLNLPFRNIYETGTLLPLFHQQCEIGFRNGLDADEIIENFFRDFTQDNQKYGHFDLLFKFIQYVERQIALFDSIEDSAFEQINDTTGKGSLKALLVQASQAGTEETLREKLRKFSLRIVLTAHPTQFYPGPVLGILTDLEKAIREHDLVTINLLLQQLGKTGFIQNEKPTPFDEAASLCWFLENVFYGTITEIVQSLSTGLQLPLEDWNNASLIKIGFWPGGDRDGNPFVTSDTTLKVAAHLRNSILKCYYRDIRLLKRRLTFQGIDKALSEVEQTLYQMAFTGKAGYSSPQALLEALGIIRTRLLADHDGLFLDLLDAYMLKVKLFGFHFATLDIRQDSRKLEYVWQVLLDQLDKPTLAAFNQQPEPEKINHLLALTLREKDLQTKDDFVNETLASIAAIQQIQESNGQSGCERYVISNCQQALHVIQVFALAKFMHRTEHPRIDVVPLFETIDDLTHAAEVMEQLYSIPKYREHLQRREDKQTIMVGFSDGTKDGGYLRANWSIFRAKEQLTTISRKYGITVLFFDGRGGPPARGGGNTHDFYASLGNTIEQDEVQITIQGQTISSNFGRAASCRYNLEQLLSAGLQSAVDDELDANLDDVDKHLLDQLADEGYQSYLELKNHHQFVPYLENVTPLTFFGDANIGSRPMKRNASSGLKFEDLRAIPFVGAWAMMKQNIPGFYGVGSALEALKKKGQMAPMKSLFQRSLFFRTLIGNSMMSLTKTNFEASSNLRHDPQYSDFWQKMHDEYELSIRMVLEVSGLTELMDNNVLKRDSVKLRESIVLPLVTIQQYALAKLRNLKTEEQAEELLYRKLIIRCMFGIINAARNSA
ncbi:MAG: phosphoenolpyruvate carboxylase [Pseudomonadales bacterium]|nr:phosphoenolpyruvate carboxylase [Pseudomonadales bacterium]